MGYNYSSLTFNRLKVSEIIFIVHKEVFGQYCRAQ